MSIDIANLIGEARSLLSEFTILLMQRDKDFNSAIVGVLGLKSIRDYGLLIDSFYTLEDTELAKEHIRNYGFGNAGDGNDFGLMYLKFYGLMNACYLQQQAIIVCTDVLFLKTDLSEIKESVIIKFRNDFSAHSPNRGKGIDRHSFVLDRFGLLGGAIRGYSSNHPSGHISRDANINELLNQWDESLAKALSPICDSICVRVKSAISNL